MVRSVPLFKNELEPWDWGKIAGSIAALLTAVGLGGWLKANVGRAQHRDDLIPAGFERWAEKLEKRHDALVERVAALEDENQQYREQSFLDKQAAELAITARDAAIAERDAANIARVEAASLVLQMERRLAAKQERILKLIDLLAGKREAEARSRTLASDKRRRSVKAARRPL
jgi:hypothetical protein